MTSDDLDQLAINTIRTLSIDAVQQANSGHPGTPMALAPLVYTLWNRVMHFDPTGSDLAEPRPLRAVQWPCLDAAVVGAASDRNAGGERRLRAPRAAVGHAWTTSATSANSAARRPDIRNIIWSPASRRPPARWGRASPPASAWRLPRKWLAAATTARASTIFDYNIYAICGDGCLMEGVGSEAASLAGHLELDDLCWIYDNNHITIEGNTRITFTEDVAARFMGYGWNVLRVGDANDIGRIEDALAIFRETKGRPTLIMLDSHIGYGSPHKHDTAAAHGEPLGEEEVKLTKRAYGWPEDAKFLVPDGVYEHFAAGIGERGAEAHGALADSFSPNIASSFPISPPRSSRCSGANCPRAGIATCRVFPADAKGIAGRDASGKVLNVLAQNIPWFLGGSADLGTSNKTTLKFAGAGDFEPGKPRRQEPALRHPRARHGGDRQRAGAFEAARIRRDVFHLQRLCAPGHPAFRDHGASDHLGLHP